MRSLLAIVSVAAAATFAMPCVAADPGSARPKEETKQDTLKERLSDKASDEQRVDDCNVPLEKRGTKKRPECAPPSKNQARK
jgi:hypothetical protein